MYSHQKPRLVIVIAVLLAFISTVRAQTRLSGSIIDSVSHQNMEGASIRLVIIHGKDTTLVAGSIARSGGRFTFNHIDAGVYHLYVSFQGYQPLWRAMVLGDEPAHVTLNMYPASQEITGLVITDTRPVKMRGDTTAYNADQFHTAPHATVGDLINKMPGIDLTRSGALLALGDTVKRILVNGKRFFSNDLQVALKYLPRDVVASIQIFDDKSDQARFTGIDDGVRIRTINIVLKKNVKSNIVGNASMAAGGAIGSHATSGALYKGDVGLNRFKGETMTSVIGSADNTPPTLGGMDRTGSGGINYSNRYGQHTQVSGSFRSSGHGTETSLATYTQSLLPGDSTVNSRAVSYSSSHRTSQSFNANLETDPSQHDHLTVRGAMDIGSTRDISGSQTASTRGTTVPLNNSSVQATSKGHSLASSAGLVWGHRFAKAGRSASLEAGFESFDYATAGTNKYDNTYFKTAAPDSMANVDQSYNAMNSHLTASVHATYEEPVFKNSSVQLEYILSTDQTGNGRNTYDLDSLSGKYNRPDSAYTNRFKNDYRYQQGGVKYHYGNKAVQFTTGIGIQYGAYISTDQTHDATLRQGYTLFHPMASATLTPKKNLNIEVNYEGRGDVPPINDLQPVINNTNPLNITIGNPNLRQSFIHTMRIGINSFDPSSANHLSLDLQGTLTRNSTVSVNRLDASTGIDTTAYTNLNGNYSLSMYLDYGLRLKRPASNLSLGASVSEDRNVGYINETLNKTSSYYVAGNLKWTTNLPDHIDLTAYYSPQYVIGLYSAEPSQNTHYITHELYVDGLYYTTSGWQFGTSFAYDVCSGRPTGFNPTSAKWNITVSRSMFKNKAGEIKLTANNILDQVNLIATDINASQIKNTTGTMLGRFLLLGFIYHFAPPKQPN